MKRVRINLEQLADWNNLYEALFKAAKSKRKRSDVRHFFDNVEKNIAQMSVDILDEKLPYGNLHSFKIYDPKPRIIHAAKFPDRVFHHALINIAGPILERRMSDYSYACRINKGVHRAAREVQKYLRQYPYYGQIDIDGYFAAISHNKLKVLLARHFKGRAFLVQLERVIESYSSRYGYGLPIGSLTSQYFANSYLNGLDNFLANDQRVCAQVRYMDDIIWWCKKKSDVKLVLNEIKTYLLEQWELCIKINPIIQSSKQGAAYCGFRIYPAVIRLSRRRIHRYKQRQQYWENLWKDGKIDDLKLQQAYASVLAITHGCNASAWRRQNLIYNPPPDV